MNRRLGLRRTLIAGLSFAAVGCVALLPTGASTQLVVLTPAFLAIGIGIAMATPAMMTAALASAQVGRSGIGSGVVNSARQIGGALGVALFGSLVSASANFLIGFRQVLVLAAASLLAAAAAVFLAIPPQTCQTRGKRE